MRLDRKHHNARVADGGTRRPVAFPLFRGILPLALIASAVIAEPPRSPAPVGLYVSGPPASARSRSVLPDLAGKAHVAGFLVRLAWQDLEARAGEYDFSLLHRELGDAARLGKNVALALVSGPHAPGWLMERGAQAVELERRGRVSRIPLPWDATVENAWCALIRAAGRACAPYSNLALVHMTHSTINGFELPLAFSPTEEEAWRAKGYAPEKLVASWQRVMPAFAQAFPDAPIDLEVHPILRDDGVAQALVAFGHARWPGRFGVFAAWWSVRNTGVYPGMDALLREAVGRSFAAVQLVASETPNAFNPGGGIGEGGLSASLELAQDRGIRYFEIWESDLRNPALEPSLVRFAASLNPPR